MVLVTWVGVAFTRRAGQDLDEYFLSGRSLPWWISGTSMVATSFSADTPLVITGWVREAGISRNWVWWCLALSGTLQVFLFARWWRRGRLMTKAELAELRYGGSGARFLRGLLGLIHAAVLNTMILGWVLLAGMNISRVLFGVDKVVGLALACGIALAYSLLAGLWGVVLTDLFQFVLSMAGAIVLGVVCWDAVGGQAGVAAAVAAGTIPAGALRFLPEAGPGGPLDASFWTPGLTTLVLFLGVQWWASESVDGAGAAVQRICAARNERQGMLAVLWFNVSHYALRPWCWICVALASLIVLPALELRAPSDGRVAATTADALAIETPAGELLQVALDVEGAAPDWRPEPRVAPGEEVRAGQVIARTNAELAYVVMMRRFLPPALLGLVAASLIAAFMSTVDTHINLAASFFVNDVYRRFLRPTASTAHYVLAARVTSVAVMAVGALIAYRADSIGALFLFFLAFGGGVGVVYVLRWFWWRVRASTEITAMLASIASSTALTQLELEWRLGPLSPGGALSAEGRLLLVALFSLVCALVSMAVTRAPDPRTLVEFYRRIRPPGAWGPVRALCPDAGPSLRLAPALLGWAAGLALTFGAMLGIGFLVLGRGTDAAIAGGFTLAGALGTAWALRRSEPEAAA